MNSNAFDVVRQSQLVGSSQLISNIRAYLAKVARTDSSVLITGETGTGKELAAELIHTLSARNRQPFACINCAAIPDDLLESELFGYEKGAFTGASSSNVGKLCAANGGTVFLDEIGDMSPYIQAKMLRVLESRKVQRLGGNQSVPLNVRIVAATNQDLEHLMKERKFRLDLYFRLNVVRIHLPPLRERKEDIPVIFHHYLRNLGAALGRDLEGVHPETLESLLHYDWPGNVRELRNVVEALMVDPPLGPVSFDDLPEPFRARLAYVPVPFDTERERLLLALQSTSGNRSEAARMLSWSRMTLYRKLAKHGLSEWTPH